MKTSDPDLVQATCDLCASPIADTFTHSDPFFSESFTCDRCGRENAAYVAEVERRWALEPKTPPRPPRKRKVTTGADLRRLKMSFEHLP